jgi:hypothetical protein
VIKPYEPTMFLMLVSLGAFFGFITPFCGLVPTFPVGTCLLAGGLGAISGAVVMTWAILLVRKLDR